MTTVEALLDTLQRYHATIRPVGPRLRLQAHGPLPEGLIEQLRSHKAELRVHILLQAAVEGLPLTAGALRAHLAPQDVEDLAAGRLDETTLRAYAEVIVVRRAREGGQVPEGWTQVVVCAGCGPVWLWPGLPPRVDGCPWCWNRTRGLPVPGAG